MSMAVRGRGCHQGRSLRGRGGWSKRVALGTTDDATPSLPQDRATAFIASSLFSSETLLRSGVYPVIHSFTWPHLTHDSVGYYDSGQCRCAQRGGEEEEERQEQQIKTSAQWSGSIQLHVISNFFFLTFPYPSFSCR